MIDPRKACFVIASILSAAAISARAAPSHPGADLPPYIDLAARHAIAGWLTLHPGYRVLDDGDCNCDDDLRDMRTQSDGVWKPIPAYHPYYLVGDLRGDGRGAVAVGLIRQGTEKQFQVLIIDRYRATGSARRHAFLSRQFDLGEGLFFGPPRPKPYRLVVGAFASEGWVFVPARGGGYGLR